MELGNLFHADLWEGALVTYSLVKYETVSQLPEE